MILVIGSREQGESRGMNDIQVSSQDLQVDSSDILRCDTQEEKQQVKGRC